MTTMQENSLSGKNIILTGGTTGIGRSAAITLAGLGANVLIAGHDQGHLNDTLESVDENIKSNINGIVADLSTEDGVTQLFDEADKRFDRLDVLVNNAALAFKGAMEGNYNDFKSVVSTNLLSYISCSKLAVDRMKSGGKGHIVNIGSMSADVREQDGSVYVATKAGIQAFSESFRKEVNEAGVKVTLIEPGAVDTDMQEQDSDEKKEQVKKGEMLDAQDIANAVVYALQQPDRCDVVELKIRPHLQLI